MNRSLQRSFANPQKQQQRLTFPRAACIQLLFEAKVSFSIFVSFASPSSSTKRDRGWLQDRRLRCFVFFVHSVIRSCTVAEYSAAPVTLWTRCKASAQRTPSADLAPLFTTSLAQPRVHLDYGRRRPATSLSENPASGGFRPKQVDVSAVNSPRTQREKLIGHK